MDRIDALTKATDEWAAAHIDVFEKKAAKLSSILATRSGPERLVHNNKKQSIDIVNGALDKFFKEP